MWHLWFYFWTKSSFESTCYNSPWRKEIIRMSSWRKEMIEMYIHIRDPRHVYFIITDVISRVHMVPPNIACLTHLWKLNFERKVHFALYFTRSYMTWVNFHHHLSYLHTTEAACCFLDVVSLFPRKISWCSHAKNDF